MDGPGSLILLRSSSVDRSRRLHLDVLGLAISRDSGPPDDPDPVFCLSPGLLEVCGSRQRRRRAGTARRVSLRPRQSRRTSRAFQRVPAGTRTMSEDCLLASRHESGGRLTWRALPGEGQDRHSGLALGRSCPTPARAVIPAAAIE